MSVPEAAAIARWRAGQLVPLDHCGRLPSRTVAADSWLVDDGRALALDLHRARFLAGAAGVEDASPFWDTVLAGIPRTGAWFPRVELHDHEGAPLLLARMRPAPARKDSVVLITHHGPDPRTRPRVKGPDLAALLRLRARAQAAGADEPVLLSPDGFVVEGATSSIVWWREDRLCVPDRRLPRVDSVTARVLGSLAAGLGLPVAFETARPSDLDGLEVWAVNALHGLRLVTDWPEGPRLTARPGRLAEWRGGLAALRRPLDTGHRR